MLRAITAMLALGSLAAAMPASAETYPAQPVKIVVPFAAGGPADLYARIIAQHLQQAFGQSFVVDDRPGAGSIIGTQIVAESAPDGETLLLMSNTHTVNETLFQKKSFQLMKDFVPVAPINVADLVLVANPKVKANNLAEFIKLAKAKPGDLNYASSGPGTPYHMAGELFKYMAGVDIVHVPYKGSSAARTDVLGGQVDVMFDSVTTMADFIRQGKVKAFGTTGKTRSALFPDMPTIGEAGVPGYEATIWLGLMAPKNTPAEIVDRLNAEITKIAKDPKVREEWAKQGTTPMVMTPDEFGTFINQDIAKWAKLVKATGMKID
jgi:tripartite-type tricarboxylate transporter receptor subunit TctC